MNIAVINIKDLVKHLTRILVIACIVILIYKGIKITRTNLKDIINNRISKTFFSKCISKSSTIIKYFDEDEETALDNINIFNISFAILDKDIFYEKPTEPVPLATTVQNTETTPEVKTEIEIPKIAETQNVEEKNISENYNTAYDTVKVNNECDYELTEEMLTPNIELTNTKDIVIYHTHTSESYTQSEGYYYEATGNYRTIDSNYNVVRVGRELEKYLKLNSFNVVHDATYHDYPSYSGSYSRSLETAENLLYNTDTQIVFDIHRDAIGDGDTYRTNS